MCEENSEAIIRGLQEELEEPEKQIALLQEKGKELKRVSITDGLTGLHNQRHFHDRLGSAGNTSCRDCQEGD